jgi:hypothetical protein
VDGALLRIISASANVEAPAEYWSSKISVDFTPVAAVRIKL